MAFESSALDVFNVNSGSGGVNLAIDAVAFTCSKSTIKASEQYVEPVQSLC